MKRQHNEQKYKMSKRKYKIKKNTGAESFPYHETKQKTNKQNYSKYMFTCAWKQV